VGNQELAQLRGFSDETGVPVAFLMRRAIVEYVDKHRGELTTGQLIRSASTN
jgi:hypothetical protein